ncbi:MAG: hypothetical protein NC084_04700 [Bacteroides sp.]|nr:hypothetical protein [Eubacterium sp.]MCM1418750.1 hypothetical protein [Roseburia sp.]MCM1461995.1 hypothetical protein [Bacteroides sp.]
MEEEEEKLHLGHRERMRRIALTEGLEGFNEHQVLEVLLFFAIPSGDTNPAAHRLIERFGSLRGVLSAGRDELVEVKGIGENAANLIAFSRLFAGRYLRAASFEDERSRRFAHTNASRQYYEGVFLGEEEEQIRAMAVTEDLRLVKEAKVLAGTFGKVELSARKLADFAIRNGCDRVILAHNHPRGAGMPSQADISATTDLARLLFELDILLLDHIIVGRTGSYSLRASPNAKVVWPDEDVKAGFILEGTPCPDEEEGPLDTPELDRFIDDLSKVMDMPHY